MRLTRISCLRILFIALILFLLAFLIPSGTVTAEETAYPPLEINDKGGPVPDPESYTSDTSYVDPTIQVEIFNGTAVRMDEEGIAHNTKYLYARIKVIDPSQVRTASASGSFRKGTYIGTSIAKRVDSVLAVSGDYFIHSSNGNTGYIVRQGTRYRNNPKGKDLLMIDSNGDMHGLYAAGSKDIDAFYASLSENVEIWNAFTFGPILVDNGVVAVDCDTEYFSVGTQVPAQRLCIGQIGPLEYFVVSTEGPEDGEGSGMTIPQFADVVSKVGYEFSENGAKIAYNLDGGSTNTMIFKNKKVNSPGSPKIRGIGDIIYFATLVPEK